MDEYNHNSRVNGAASRPPEAELTEDTPLFAEVPYTPIRRTANNGRPAAASTRPASDDRPAAAPYGGRSYSSAHRQAPRNTSASPRQPNRVAPVYTELSWDDLMRGTQSQPTARPLETASAGTFPGAGAPASRGGSAYFGGFDQEMEELFYGRGENARQASVLSGSPAPRQNDSYSRSPVTTEGYAASTRTRETANIRPAASPRYSYPPQSTARRPQQRSTTPAPAQRSAAARSQWSGVFGGNPNAPSEKSTSSRPVRPARSGGTIPPAGTGTLRTASSRAGRRPIPPLFLGGGLVLVALLVFLIARLTGDSSSTPRPASAPVNMSTVEPMESLPPASTPETEVETTPSPTPAPSPTPSGPKAKKVGDLIVPADWGPTIPQRTRAVYDSYFDKSCMIGNSLVDGFRTWSGMTNLRYIFHTGATVSNAMGNLDLAPITLNPAGYYENIYLMFGLNEIGTDVNSFVQGYKRLVDYIREYQPTANIVCISVTPVMKKVDEDPNEVQSMDRIRNFNAALQEFCVDQNCWYLDIYHLLLDDDGYLSGDYAFIGDGKHFEKSGYVAWANYMKTHYVDDKLLTE